MTPAAWLAVCHAERAPDLAVRVAHRKPGPRDLAGRPGWAAGAGTRVQLSVVDDQLVPGVDHMLAPRPLKIGRVPQAGLAPPERRALTCDRDERPRRTQYHRGQPCHTVEWLFRARARQVSLPGHGHPARFGRGRRHEIGRFPRDETGQARRPGRYSTHAPP